MSKKLFVVVIAIVLVAAITGTCFALYSVDATSKSVDISAGYQVVNMQFKNDDNSAVLANVNLADKFSPTLTSQTIDVVLAITNGSLADGVHGNFTAALTGTLAEQVDVTVNLLTAVGGSLSTDITAAATGSGYDVALSATPIAIRITIALKAAAIADFSLAAEKTATLTLNWLKVAATVWTLSEDDYYLAGSFSGVDKWVVSEENQNVKLTTAGVEGENVAQILGIHLDVNDEYKVVKGANTIWYSSWESATANFTNTAGQMKILTAGTYNIYLAYNESDGYRTYIDLVSAD